MYFAHFWCHLFKVIEVAKYIYVEQTYDPSLLLIIIFLKYIESNLSI